MLLQERNRLYMAADILRELLAADPSAADSEDVIRLHQCLADLERSYSSLAAPVGSAEQEMLAVDADHQASSGPQQVQLDSISRSRTPSGKPKDPVTELEEAGALPTHVDGIRQAWQQRTKWWPPQVGRFNHWLLRWLCTVPYSYPSTVAAAACTVFAVPH